MFEFEEIEEATARNYAKEHNIIFKLVSAKSSNGIEDIFQTIGKILLDPHSEDATNSLRKNSIKITRIQQKSEQKQKKVNGCCLTF
jgi:hypothetical protein